MLDHTIYVTSYTDEDGYTVVTGATLKKDEAFVIALDKAKFYNRRTGLTGLHTPCIEVFEKGTRLGFLKINESSQWEYFQYFPSIVAILEKKECGK